MMKRLPYDVIIDTLLTACCAIAFVCAVPTAYDVHFNPGVLISLVLCRSFLVCLAFHTAKKAWQVCAVSFGIILVLCIIRFGLIANGAKLVWYSSVRLLSLDFSFIPTPADPGEITNAAICVNEYLIILASAVAAVTALLLIRRRSRVLALLVPVPAFIPALIYTDCPPALFTVALLLVYWFGVLFGRERTVEGAQKAGPAKAVFVMLLALLALLLPLIIPEDRFEPIPFSERRGIIDVFGSARDGMLSRNAPIQKEYDLSDAGEHTVDKSKTFSVCGSSEGVLLLRTHSYGLYGGSVWRAAKEYSGEWDSMLALGQTQSGDSAFLRIREAYVSERLTPYGFQPRYDVEPGESFIRANGRTAYVWSYFNDMELSQAADSDEENRYIRFALDQYTLSDGKTRRELLKLLEEISGSAETADELRAMNSYFAALKVASMVSSRGEYSLKPGSAPAGRDFVEYFLRDNKKGYCVHYASATAALLQAVGIPARYVIGYRIDITEADTWIDVPNKASHAWTEVYVKGVGWLPVESTPGFEAHILPGAQGGGLTVYASAEPEPSEEASPRTPRTTSAPRRSPRPKAEMSIRPIPTIAPVEDSKHESSFDPLWLLVIPAALLVWQAVGAVIRRRRQRSFEAEDPNAAVLAMLGYLGQLEKYGAEKVKNAEALANEAAFSNHRMDEKRDELQETVRKTQRELCRSKPLKRFALRWLTFRI